MNRAKRTPRAHHARHLPQPHLFPDGPRILQRRDARAGGIDSSFASRASGRRFSARKAGQLQVRKTRDALNRRGWSSRASPLSVELKPTGSGSVTHPTPDTTTRRHPAEYPCRVSPAVANHREGGFERISSLRRGSPARRRRLSSLWRDLLYTTPGHRHDSASPAQLSSRQTSE